MFEQLVRPFQTRPVTTTRRIVPVVSEGAPETATLSWGKAGTVPAGVRQPDATNLENIESVGFRVQAPSQRWRQTSRVGEDVSLPIRSSAGTQIGETVVDRTKEITFTAQSGDETVRVFASVSPSGAVSGLRTSIPGANTSGASYTLEYD